MPGPLMDSIKLKCLTVSGGPSQLGEEQGEEFRDAIYEFLSMRFDSVSGYFADRGITKTADGNDPFYALLMAAAKSEEMFRKWDPDGYLEHRGIADGAGLDSVELYAATNMTDMRDAVILSAKQGPPLSKLASDSEGCTSLMVPTAHTDMDGPLVGQTWDLNPPDVEYVVAIHRKPTNGLQTWSVTCTGCLSLVGINENGVSVGTTNIKTYGSRAGVGYLSLLHRLLRSDTAKDAEAIGTKAPIAGAHTYWIADEERQCELESSPNGVFVRYAEHVPVFRTNHCLAPEHQSVQGELPSPSSHKRLTRVGELLDEPDVNILRLRKLFADRKDGVDSINRYEEDDQGTATNAVFISSPAQRTAWACRGPADRGEWVELTF